jgi:hypothetical protein
MKAINQDALKSFLREKIESLSDATHGRRYRASVRLTDGTHLPCVIFQDRKYQVELALRRFKDLKWRKEEYKRVVGTFVSKGSHVSDWQIAEVSPSPFAWPLSLLKVIHGETAMSWTSFVAEMQDGSLHSYGTTFSTEFFDLPPGYKYEDIGNIKTGMVYSANRGLTNYSLDALNEAVVYRELIFFTCFVDGLD